MQLSDLIERVEKLNKPDREIDAHVHAVTHGGRVHFIDTADNTVVWEKPIDGFWIRRLLNLSRVPRLTASLDAAVALTERLLPGQEWAVGRRDNFCNAWGKVRIGTLESVADVAPTPAIALVLATLKALAATHPAEDGR